MIWSVETKMELIGLAAKCSFWLKGCVMHHPNNIIIIKLQRCSSSAKPQKSLKIEGKMVWWEVQRNLGGSRHRTWSLGIDFPDGRWHKAYSTSRHMGTSLKTQQLASQTLKHFRSSKDAEDLISLTSLWQRNLVDKSTVEKCKNRNETHSYFSWQSWKG